MLLWKNTVCFIHTAWKSILGVFPWFVLVAVIKLVCKPFQIICHTLHIGQINLIQGLDKLRQAFSRQGRRYRPALSYFMTYSEDNARETPGRAPGITAQTAAGAQEAPPGDEKEKIVC